MSSLKAQTTKYYLRFILKYKIAFTLTLLGVAVGTLGLSIFGPFVIKLIVDQLSLVTASNREEIFSNALKLTFLYLFASVIGNIGWRSALFLNSYYQASALRDIENDAFEKLQKHSFNFFANNFGGALVTKTNRLSRAFEALTDKFKFDFFTLFIKFISIMIIVSFYSWILVIIFLGWFILYSTFSFFANRWKFKFDQRAAEEDSKVTAALADAITNSVNVKFFSNLRYEIFRFFEISQSRYKARKKDWDIGTIIEIFQGIAMTIFEGVAIIFTLYLWNTGAITIGTVLLVVFYLFNLNMSIWGLGRVIREVFEAYADAEEMIDIIHTEPEIQDKNTMPIKIKNGNIEFKDIFFSYGKDKKVFEKFNLKIEKGESIGLVGESGSGKTTITKLLLRFGEVQKGKVLVDGYDVKELRQDDLRDSISYVPQDPILFHRTLYENISYSNPKAQKENVYGASKKASIHNFILSLKDGYNTYVGERGIKLSGGERQRVAIARAMLKKSPIVILDEATSSLDSNSEMLIQKSIKSLIKGKTTIIIAHRLSTVKMLDKIIVLDKGKIIQVGTHSELIKKKGKYSQLWKHQSSGIIN